MSAASVSRCRVVDRLLSAGQPAGAQAMPEPAAGLGELTDITTCTADEVALHMIIDRAEELEDEGSFDSVLFSGLPRRDRDDDFFGLKDALLRDLDVLLLFDPSLDGVEDPTSEAYQLERFENLHPRDWFKAFENKV